MAFCRDTKHVNPSCTKVFGAYTFYKGGGRLSPPPPRPMISETVDSTTLKFGTPLGLYMGGKKTSEVVDVSLAKFPWQLFYLRVFSTNFAKNG